MDPREATPTLTGLLATSNTLLESVWALRQRMAGAGFAHYNRLISAYPEFCAKLQRRFLEHPITEMRVDKPNEQEALNAFRTAARELVVTLQPAFDLLKECLKFQSRAERLLADLHTMLMPLTLGGAPLLLREYMRVFSNACRLVMLLKGLPRKDIVQLYTIACHELIGRDPPARRALCSFLAACDSPVALLQHRFLCVSQRVCQILELVAVPALLNFSSADVLAASQVLDTFHADDPRTMGVRGFSMERTYQMLQNLDEYRSWSLLGFLACPAALAGVGARAALSTLLSESLVLHVYEEVTEPLHPLFEAHVRPSLEKLTEVIKDQGADRTTIEGERAAARNLVDDAWRAAAAGAAREHMLRRLYISRALQDLGDELEDTPCLLPHRLPALLGAISYAKGEALWYFRHVGETLPAGPPRGPLGHQPTATVPADGRVVQLLASMARLQLLLARYASAIRTFQQQRMRATLLQQLDAGTAAISAVATAGLEAAQRGVREAPRPGDASAAAALQVAQQMADIAATLQVICRRAAAVCGATAEPEASGNAPRAEPSSSAMAVAAEDEAGPSTSAGAGGEASGSPAAAEGERSALVVAASGSMMTVAGEAVPAPEPTDTPMEQWLAVCTQLCSAHSALRTAQLELPAKDPRYVEAVNELLATWQFVTDLPAALRPACSLDALRHCAPKLRRLVSSVLDAATSSTSSAAAAGEALDCLPSCPGVLRQLWWFDGRPDAKGRAGAEVAAALADEIISDHCAALRDLMLRAAKEMHQELYPAAPPRRGFAAAAKAAAAVAALTSPGKRRAAGAGDATSRDQQPGSNGATAAAEGDGTAASETEQGQQGAEEEPKDKTALADKLIAAVAAPQLAAQQLIAARSVVASNGGSAASLIMRATCLASALDQIGAVQISSATVKVPREFMRSALQRAVHEMMASLVCGASGPPPPSQLAARARCLQSVVAQLSPALGFDLSPDLFEALLLHAQPEPGTEAHPLDLAAAPGGALAAAETRPGGPAMRAVDAYGIWMQDVIVRDVRGLGVMYAPAARSFTCVSPAARADVAAYASLPELIELFRVFGPYAAQVLASHLEQPVAEAMAYLDTQLAALHGALEPVMAAMNKTNGRCLPEVRAALSRSAGAEGAILSTVKLLGRCLALRQLISEAAAAALTLEFPVLSDAPEFAGSVTGAGVVYDPPRHACDVFDLPRPGARTGGSPRTADPFVTKLLVGNNSYERYQRWFNLPVLLGLALASPTVGATPPPAAAGTGAPAAGYDPSLGAITNEVHAVAFAAKALALAHREAANKMLQCGSAFLHPGAEAGGAGGQAADALEAFSRVAAAVIYSRDDPSSVKSAKHLVMATLDCDQLPAKQLGAAWLPPARRWSALAQASRGAGGY